jgi:2-polyprenyl-3-methyl-5-hydroxy-6-metoxy-1,4-benzoquinol methylase
MGMRFRPSRNDINNLLNHEKFYLFAAQFVESKAAVDVGCGTGYGCEILKRVGRAREVFGCDVSRHALRYARSHFGESAKFSLHTATDLGAYETKQFDVGIMSEVLEHVKEYRMERTAIAQMKRVVREGGLIVIATPNSELLEHHGFSYDEIHSICDENFSSYHLLENALIPFDNEMKEHWEKRLKEGHVGVIVSENVNLHQTVLPSGSHPKLKSGIDPKYLMLGGYRIDLTLLHNTHSWVVLAINGKRSISHAPAV